MHRERTHPATVTVLWSHPTLQYFHGPTGRSSIPTASTAQALLLLVEAVFLAGVVSGASRTGTVTDQLIRASEINSLSIHVPCLMYSLEVWCLRPSTSSDVSDPC